MKSLLFLFCSILFSSCNIFGDTKVNSDFVKKVIRSSGSFPTSIVSPIKDIVFSSDNNYMYFCDNATAQFEIYDISDPDNITHVKNATDLESVSCNDMEVYGNILVKTTGGTSFYLYDISDPLNITYTSLVGTTNSATIINQITFRNDRMYVVDQNVSRNIEVWDISNFPNSVTRVGVNATNGGTDSILIDGSYIYTGGYDATPAKDFFIYDATDDNNFIEKGQLSVANIAPTAMGLYAGRVVAAFSNNLYAINTSDKDSPYIEVDYGFFSTTSDFELKTSDIFIQYNPGSQVIGQFDISDPHNPLQVNSVFTQANHTNTVLSPNGDFVIGYDTAGGSFFYVYRIDFQN